MREAIGDENVPIKIKKIDPWILRESVAKSFQDGRDILLVGIFQSEDISKTDFSNWAMLRIDIHLLLGKSALKWK